MLQLNQIYDVIVADGNLNGTTQILCTALEDVVVAIRSALLQKREEMAPSMSRYILGYLIAARKVKQCIIERA